MCNQPQRSTTSPIRRVAEFAENSAMTLSVRRFSEFLRIQLPDPRNATSTGLPKIHAPRTEIYTPVYHISWPKSTPNRPDSPIRDAQARPSRPGQPTRRRVRTSRQLGTVTYCPGLLILMSYLGRSIPTSDMVTLGASAAGHRLHREGD